MSGTVNCSFCGSPYRVPAELAGQEVSCPNCGQVGTAPGVAQPAAGPVVAEPAEGLASPYYGPATSYPLPLGGGRSYAMRPHRGATILVLGILGFVICFILGIIAWSMGNTDLLLMRKGAMDPSGRSLTEAGRLCGMICAILNLIWFAFVVLYVFGGFALMGR